ncbi:hypothetical protein CDAR_391651 [Caerostris darwini]|uniref:Uncharacterized protein n=1 Tax=Caerostris darwini TaxID=1538125 RepID=A0AAV4R1Z2_9ARAC|nr:hypothetical protein CDAR_391651 [Caerostris darwini]
MPATSYSLSLQGRRSGGDEIPLGRSGPRQMRQEIPSGHFEGREKKKIKGGGIRDCFCWMEMNRLFVDVLAERSLQLIK